MLGYPKLRLTSRPCFYMLSIAFSMLDKRVLRADPVVSFGHSLFQFNREFWREATSLKFSHSRRMVETPMYFGEFLSTLV